VADPLIFGDPCEEPFTHVKWRYELLPFCGSVGNQGQDRVIMQHNSKTHERQEDRLTMPQIESLGVLEDDDFLESNRLKV